MADPDISVIGITAGIVIGKVAQSLPTQWRELRHGDLALWIIATERGSTVAYSRAAAQGFARTRHFRSMWTLVAIGAGCVKTRLRIPKPLSTDRD
jgi:hypothetical protein